MTSAAETVAPAPRARRGLGSRAWAFVKRHALTVYALLVVAYLMLPIGVVILISFNAPKSNFNYVWQGFTFDNWADWNSVLGIQDAVVTSLEVGLLATVVATVLGPLLALGGDQMETMLWVLFMAWQAAVALAIHEGVAPTS